MDNPIAWLVIISAALLVARLGDIIAFIMYMFTCQLHDSVIGGNLNKVKKYLKEERNINALDPRFGQAPLHYAIVNKHLEIATLLVQHGASLTQKSVGGFTPLYCANKYFALNQRRELLNAAVNLKGTDNEGRTLLHLAAIAGDKEITHEVITQGHDLNARDSLDLTPLFWALAESNQEVVELLVKHGADVNIRNKDGSPPLSVAAGLGNVASIELLISHGAEVNLTEDDGWTPLHYAAYKGHKDAVKALLGHGARGDTKDRENLTPKDHAIKQGHVETVALFD